jgi:hypothetical protein
VFRNLTQLAGLLRSPGQITSRIQQVKVTLRKTQVQGKAGQDHVRIDMNGMGELHRVAIASELVSPDRHAELEAKVAEAVAAAFLEARRLHLAALRELTGGLDLPGMDKIIAELAE